MRLWRLSDPWHAERFDGGYGLRNAGRWNQRGHAVTYCSSVPSLCVLEKLVHVEDVRLFPAVQALVHIEAPDDLEVDTLEPRAPLQDGWERNQETTRLLGATWYLSLQAPLLRVPSAIVPTTETADRNFIINHRHPRAGEVKPVMITPFKMDERLLALRTRS